MNDLEDFFRRWRETAHLSALVPSIKFTMPDGTPVNDGVDAQQVVRALEEFLAIADTHQDPPASMVEAAEKVRVALPPMRAFLADPLNVMRSGVN